MPLDQERKEAIERLLNYAEHHLHSVSVPRDKDSFRFGFDHFLLTVSAVAENLKEAVGWEVSPKPADCTLEPAFAPVVWAWFARVHVAHRYVDFLGSRGTPFSGAIGGHAIGSMAINDGFVPTLLGVYDQRRNVTVPPPPDLVHAPARLGRIVLDFWRSAYECFATGHDLPESLGWVGLWRRIKDAEH